MFSGYTAFGEKSGYERPRDAPKPVHAADGEGASRRGGRPRASSHVEDLIKGASSDLLITPDWGLNMEVVDYVNRGDAREQKNVVECLLKRISTNDSHVLLLGLTLVEACVKNCGTGFHEHVSRAGLATRVATIALTDGRILQEVRDMSARMVREWQREIPLPDFQKAAGRLDKSRVDVGPQASSDAITAPIHTPPARYATKETKEEAANQEAIAAALRDLDASHAAAAEAAANAAAAANIAAVGLMTAGERSTSLLASSGSFGATYVPSQSGSLGPDRSTQVVASQPLDVGQLVRAASHSAQLLKDMLEAVPDASSDPSGAASALDDELIAMLVRQCGEAKGKINALVADVHDEALLMQALAANDELGFSLMLHESLCTALDAPLKEARARQTAQAHTPEEACPVETAELPTSSGGYVPPTVSPLADPAPAEEEGAIELKDITLATQSSSDGAAQGGAGGDAYADLICFDEPELAVAPAHEAAEAAVVAPVLAMDAPALVPNGRLAPLPDLTVGQHTQGEQQPPQQQQQQENRLEDLLSL